MSDPRHILRTLAAEDRPGAVWCAGHCALSVAHLWRDDAPRRAVRLALAWAVGEEVETGRLRAAPNAAYDNASAYAASAANAASYANAAYAAPSRHLEALHAYVLHETTPIAPSAWWVRHAHPAAQIVWDVAASDLPPARVGTLGDALRRAHVLRLRWHQPIERAIAERLDLDHPALVALRRSVGGRCLQCGTTGRVPA